MLSELVATVGQLTDADAIARCLTERIKWLLPATRCSLLLLENGGTAWTILRAATTGGRDALRGGLALAIDRQTQVVEDDAGGGGPARVSPGSPQMAQRRGDRRRSHG